MPRFIPSRPIAAAAIAIAALSIAAPLSPAGAETLEEALAKAYQNNPTLLAARARLRAADEGVPQALSGWRPTVEATYDGGKSYSSISSGTTSTAGQSTNRSPHGGDLSIEQNIFQGGRTVSRTEGAEQDVLAERARLASTEQRIMLDAATAYMNVVRDEAVLRLNQNNERVLQRQLEATQDRFRVGEVTRTDVAQAEARLSRARSDRLQSEGNLANSRAAYRDVVGDFPGTLEPAQPLGNLPATGDEATGGARSDNPDVRASRYTERSAAAAIRTVTGELLPSVDVQGRLFRDNNLVSFDRSEGGTVTATLSVPLYQAGSVSSRVRQAKQNHSQRRQEVDAAVRTAIAQATQAWENYQTARAQILAFDSEVKASEIALEGVRQEAQVGSRTVLDVLDAEQELLNARVGLVRARRDEVVTSFDLRRSIGTLLATRLSLPVPTYDPEAYYKNVRDKWFGLGTGEE
jgi:TolC family type I secretion outer membrane protein